MLMAQQEEDPLNMLSQKAGQAAGQFGGASTQQQQMGQNYPGLYPQQQNQISAWTPTQYDPNTLGALPSVTDPVSVTPPGVITPDEESPNPVVPKPAGGPTIDLEVPEVTVSEDPNPVVPKPAGGPEPTVTTTVVEPDPNPVVPKPAGGPTNPNPVVPKPAGGPVPDTGQLGMAIANNNPLLRK